MLFFLGIDGGGTKTECAVGDEVNLLGRATAPSCKIQAVGDEPARAALHAAIHDACRQAGVEPRQIARVCAGLAGVSRGDIRQRVTEMVRELVPGDVEVVGDNEIAMEAAFGVLPGVIVIAGTGSIAHGRNGAGEQARAGGWGGAVSDEGSGGWIGRAAVAEVMRGASSETGTMGSSGLLTAIMRAWRVTAREDLARIANAMPPPDFAALFPVVLEAANQQDDAANLVLTRAGAELARLAKTVMDNLWPRPGATRVRVRIAGGVFRNSAQVRRAFFGNLLAQRADAAVNFVIVDPVAGALALARRTATRPAAHA
jgi:glucosamine kinase